MPQLLSRMDDMSWLTPSIAEILDQGAPPPGGDGSIRDQQKMLQNRFSALEAPIRILNIRPYPSYTLFIARPEAVGRLTNRRTVTSNEIRRSLGQIAEEQSNWQFGFLPTILDDEEMVGIIVRTEEHSPLSLRRLLVRTTFRDHPSTMAIMMGNSLEQRLVVHDLAEIGNLLVIGSENAKLHFIRALLLTITSMNTPSELRLAITGEQSELHKQFTSLPHAVGRALVSPKDGQRLLEGLSKELTRRRNVFEENGFRDISEYNARLKEEHDTIMPRILVVVDSLSDESWQAVRNQWIPLLTHLLEDRGQSGIHVVMTAEQFHAPDVPGAFDALLPVKIIMRASATNQAEEAKNFHSSLLRFVDAFVVDNSVEDKVTPVELCAVSEDEIQTAISYWKQAAATRSRETELTQVSGRTGVTGVLNRNPTTEAVRVEVQKEVLADETTPKQTEPPRIEAPRLPSLQQVQALAAYLGWIGTGPLQDILGMSTQDARKALVVLKRMGVVQNNDSDTPRFVRLSDNPFIEDNE